MTISIKISLHDNFNQIIMQNLNKIKITDITLECIKNYININYIGVMKVVLETPVVDLIKVMCSPEPLFYGRLGGAEAGLAQLTYTIKKNTHNKEEFFENFTKNPYAASLISVVKKYAGFYDCTGSEEMNVKFAEYYLELLKEYDVASLAGPDFISYLLSPNMIEPYTKISQKNEYIEFLENNLKKDILLYNYHVFEEPLNFLQAFKTFAQNKKILVISPFSESIQSQKKNLNKLFANYTYPDFELLTYKTPLTFNDKNKAYVDFPHQNWFETVKAMCEDISKIDFDIALMGCAAYTLPLGAHIKKMGKKGMYVGGILQVCFGVMGQRWIGQHYYLKNKDAFVFPIETTNKINDAKKFHTKSEGFSAYF